MITDYEIRNVNNREVLYLYLNFDDEFARINFRKQSQEIKDVVTKFIKDNEIAFKGTTVVLIASGMLVSSLTLNPTQEDIKLDNIDIIENKDIEEKVIEIDEEQQEENIVTNQSLPKEKTNKTSKNQAVNNTPKATTSSGDNKVETKEEVIDNNTYIKLKRKNGEVVDIELEEYVIGVVVAEMPALFHEEALKAQSVIARTYALKAKAQNKVLTDNESTQSYKSNDELAKMWGTSYNNYHNKVKTAVLATKGEYLTYNGQYIEALYHSTSNGKTENSTNVWGNSYPYLVSVPSEYDYLNPSFESTKTFTYEELSNLLQSDINKDTLFTILGKTEGDRVSFIEVAGKKYTGVAFRNLLGLRSADFEIEKQDTNIIIKTKGYGHGVGMSQYGANGMAKNGYFYKDILLHYYKGVSLSHQ